MLLNLEKDDLEILRGKTQNKDILKALETVDLENKWTSFLEEHSIDVRIWSILNSIVSNPCVKYQCYCGSKEIYGKDIMGYEQKSYKYRRKMSYESCFVVNGIAITQDGWKEAVPELQRALDILGIDFVADSKLICKNGEFAAEEVWTDVDDYEFRLFDAGHGSSGMAGCCYPIFPARNDEKNMVEIWIRVSRLPNRFDLVKIDGWKKCSYCGKPIRPKNEKIL